MHDKNIYSTRLLFEVDYHLMLLLKVYLIWN